MAEVSVTIRRDNGMYITSNGTVDDALVVDIAQTLSAILFDLSMAPPAPAAPAPSTDLTAV